MHLPDAILESRLDLSLAQVLEPAPGQLLVTSSMTPVRAVVAAAFGVACLACAFLVWRQRSEGWLVAGYPFGLLAPIFGAFAMLVLFGEQSKAFDASHRRAEIRASLGPLQATRTYTLPAEGRVRLTFRKEFPSNANHTTATATRWYDVEVADLPPLGFTIASDREKARAFAGHLAQILGYEVQDEVEADGVTRLKP